MREIVQEGALVLREVAEPVPEDLFGGVTLAHLIREMTETLDGKPEGVALALRLSTLASVRTPQLLGTAISDYSLRSQRNREHPLPSGANCFRAYLLNYFYTPIGTLEPCYVFNNVCRL